MNTRNSSASGSSMSQAIQDLTNTVAYHIVDITSWNSNRRQFCVGKGGCRTHT